MVVLPFLLFSLASFGEAPYAQDNLGHGGRIACLESSKVTKHYIRQQLGYALNPTHKPGVRVQSLHSLERYAYEKDVCGWDYVESATQALEAFIKEEKKKSNDPYRELLVQVAAENLLDIATYYRQDLSSDEPRALDALGKLVYALVADEHSRVNHTGMSPMVFCKVLDRLALALAQGKFSFQAEALHDAALAATSVLAKMEDFESGQSSSFEVEQAYDSFDSFSGGKAPKIQSYPRIFPAAANADWHQDYPPYFDAP
jgi:hypothetical protein